MADQRHLIEETALAIELATDYLREVSETEFVDLDDEQRQLAKGLSELMTMARRQMTTAGQALKTATARRSRTREPVRRVTTDYSTNVPRRSRRKPSELGDNGFIHRLASIHEEDYMDEDEFWGLMMTQQPNHHKALTVALQVSLRGLHSFTAHQLNEFLRFIHPTTLREEGVRMNWRPIAEVDGGDMYDTLQLLRNTKNPLEVITGPQLRQHITLMLRVLRWALQWRELGEGPRPNLAKQNKEVEMWRTDKSDNRFKETILADPGWSHFHNEVADFRRGANRALLAYETFGSLVIVFPHFRWGALKDSRVGNKFSDLAQRLAVYLYDSPSRHLIEAVFQKLTHDVVAFMDSDKKSLVPGLADVQAKADRSWAQDE